MADDPEDGTARRSSFSISLLVLLVASVVVATLGQQEVHSGVVCAAHVCASFSSVVT
jgi:hypothetical protein